MWVAGEGKGKDVQETEKELSRKSLCKSGEREKLLHEVIASYLHNYFVQTSGTETDQKGVFWPHYGS